MICEHCKNCFICKGKYFRDLLIDNTRAFIDVGAIMKAIVENCTSFEETEDK